jgi:hypothetical protein
LRAVKDAAGFKYVYRAYKKLCKKHLNPIICFSELLDVPAKLEEQINK